MSPTEIDRVPIAQAQESSGLGRSAFYKRLGQAGIEPIRVSGRSFLDRQHLQALTDLQRWIDGGNDPDAWPGKLDQTGAAPLAAPVPRQLQAPLLEPEPDRQAPGELVLAELELLERLLAFLDRCAERGWHLSTSQVELLLGARPRGEGFDRHGFRFAPAGQHGREISWSVNRG